MFRVSQKVRYFNYGFIPRGKLRSDLLGWLFGELNFLKRLQAHDLLQRLDLSSDDIVLDFGCGRGYNTIEIAKGAKRVYGIDLSEHLSELQIPKPLESRLAFVRANCKSLPFANNSFHTVLAGEVLPTTKNPADFLLEIARVLRSGGKLVVANGAGHPAIREAYENGSMLLNWFRRRHPNTFPSSYQDYCRALLSTFRVETDHFFSEEEVSALLESCGFEVVSVTYSPSRLAGAFYSWTLFARKLKHERPVQVEYRFRTARFLASYYLFKVIELFDKKKYEGGLIITAVLPDADLDKCPDKLSIAYSPQH